MSASPDLLNVDCLLLLLLLLFMSYRLFIEGRMINTAIYLLPKCSMFRLEVRYLVWLFG